MSVWRCSAGGFRERIEAKEGVLMCAIGDWLRKLFGGGGAPPPEPPPPPPPDEVPPGVHHAGLLLRRNGATFVSLEGTPIDYRQAIPCCGAFEGSGWPLAAAPAWTDWAGSRGANVFHLRPGPFLTKGEPDWSEVGGPYVEVGGKADLTKWNQAFWDLIALWIYQLGLDARRVEIGVLDLWRARRQLQGDDVGHPWAPQNNVQAVDALSGLMRSTEFKGVHKAWVRKLVSEWGRFGNVTWFDGTEAGAMPGYNPEATWALRGIVKGTEHDLGMPIHMFGTNGGDDAAKGAVDYVVVHGSPARQPIANKPTVCTEYNGDPPLRPDQWMAAQCIAMRGGTYRAYWRGWQPQPLEAMDETFRLWREADCSFLNQGCLAPPADAHGWGAVIKPEQRPARMNRAVREMKERVQNARGRDPMVTLELAAYELRAMGYCATGPWEDAVAIKAPDGLYEEWHLVSFGDGAWTGDPYKGAWPFHGVWP